MLKINPTDQFKVSRQALQEILQNYDVSNFEYELPISGVSNINVIIKLEGVKKYVLRILRKNKKTYDEISLEIDFQNFLSNNSLPVAKIIQNKKSQFITFFQEGETTSVPHPLYSTVVL